LYFRNTADMKAVQESSYYPHGTGFGDWVYQAIPHPLRSYWTYSRRYAKARAFAVIYMLLIVFVSTDAKQIPFFLDHSHDNDVFILFCFIIKSYT